MENFIGFQRVKYCISFLVSDNKLLLQLLHIETQLEKLYSHYDARGDNDETKFLTVISDLADRELVITISWAKQVPGKRKALCNVYHYNMNWDIYPG